MPETSSSSKREVNNGYRETAASLAYQTQKRRPLFSLRYSFSWPLKILMILIVLVFLVGIGIFTYARVFSDTTTKQSSFSMVEQIHNLATLTTAEAYVTTVLKEENNKLFNKEISIDVPGTKQTLLLIVPATLLAGVDLNLVRDKDIVIDEENKKITLTLPHAQLTQEPSIKMDKVQTYSEEGLFRSEIDWTEGFELAAKAKTQIEQEAIELGILTKAEESAEQVLHTFFEQLGYSSEIKFQ